MCNNRIQNESYLEIEFSVKSQTELLCEMIHDSLFLKHFDILSLLQQEVIINGQEEDEGEEESRGREEVPHVVIVEEVHAHAGLIHVPANINI